MHSLKVFGSLAFASTLHMHRTKLEPRGRKCVFLGYKNGMKGVMLYDINNNTILVSRNVIHHEHIFPYSNANSTNWNYHPYKDPIDSPQHDPIIHVPSQSIESTVEEHEHHPNTTIDTLHHSNIDPESLENADENHDTQSVPDTPDIENDNIQYRLVRAKHTPHYLSDYVCNTSDASAVKSSSDIIGVVSEINHIQSNTPGKKVFVSVVLKDLKGNCINCNLWEIYGSKFLAYYNDPKNNGAIVILLNHAMVKDGQVSNAWSGSKLLINEDILEIQDFMSKLPTNEQKEKPTQSAKSLSNWSGGSQYSPVERFVHNAKCMSLSQFCKIKHETLCVTVATTLKFVVSKYGWFYYGCTRCSSKAPNPEKAYECSCGQKVEQPIPRYKIEIYVSNGESKYRFVFWDSECAAILGMTAEFMHNSMVENGEDDPMVYPDELEMLLNKKMAFRVKVQPTFSQASVWKLCDDEAFVKEIENDYIVEDNQSKTEYAKLVPNKENLETSAQTLSASGENDPESIILMTPAKDVVIADKGEEVDFEASGATQLSGTKPSKKVKIKPSS
ncbi:hypothetical protein KIW84_062984 [Lathyrus oleraceus]|uniref:Retroviral polymerase SH3-like domain-containing protein n=1 Tax=Pisum sativum TaxID=3888 RepID=A0A9D4W6H3_PEA|nr:hypothetical protein KIW84_062984 [Pisum sativum]